MPNSAMLVRRFLDIAPSTSLEIRSLNSILPLHTSGKDQDISTALENAFLCCKMFFMAVLVGWQRYVKRAFANPEDTTKLPGAKIRTDEDVECLRRAHLNDLENIVPFLVLAFIYVSTSPSEGVALAAFRIFTFSRLLHTFVYAIVVVEQPARFLAFMGGMIVNLYLTLSIMAFYWSAI